MVEKKVSKFQIWVTALGFLGILFGPSVAWVFCHGAVGDDVSENRRLADIPELTFGKISAFPKNFENFWNDHLPFRKTIRSVWNSTNVRLLRDSPNEKVLIGKTDNRFEDSWLMYTYDGDNNAVKDAQGILKFSDEYSRKVADMINRNTKEAKKLGISLYYLVAPNKEDIYVEYLPDNVKIYRSKNRTESLTEDLKKAEIENYLFVRDEMLKAKSIGQLYYKDDTHWNELGAFIGFKETMEMMFPDYKDFKYEVQILKNVRKSRDLVTLIGVTSYFEDNEPTVKYLENAKYKKNETEINAYKVIETDNSDARIKKSVMLIGDSYKSAMEDYFSRTFEKFISIHRAGYDTKILGQYKPDIVIIEFVERSSGGIGNFKL